MDKDVLDHFLKLKQNIVFDPQQELDEFLQESSQEHSTLQSQEHIIPPNQLEALEEQERIQVLNQEQENSIVDTLELLDQDQVDFDQLAQEYQQDQENQQDTPPFELTQLLEWRRHRRIYSRIPPTLLAKGKGTNVRAIRAHDSDLRLFRPTVLLPAIYREQGVSLPMGYDVLELDLVHVRPWTYHDLYGIKYDEGMLLFPDSTQEIITYGLGRDLERLLRTEINNLLEDQAQLLLEKNWVRLDNVLSVLSEEQGVSYLRSYAMIVQDQTILDIEVIREMIQNIQRDWPTLEEQQRKDRVRNYMERVYETQTLFFLLPLVMGIVPEARRSARTFLIFDPVSKEGPLNRAFQATQGFYLPGTMTLITHLEGRPIQREQAILGEKLTKEELVTFLTGKRDELEEEILPLDLNAGEFDQDQVRLRHVVRDWADELIIYEVEGQWDFWRKRMMRNLEMKLADTFVLTSTISFFSKQNLMGSEQLVRNADFKVDRYFLFNKGIFTKDIHFTYGQEIMLVCNSTTLVVQGKLIDQNRPNNEDKNVIEYYNILIILTEIVREAIIWSWRNINELRLCVSKTSRHLNQSGRIYYGPGLGQYIVIDRNGTSRVIFCPTQINTVVQEEATRQGISFGQLKLCLETVDAYVLITNEYRAYVSKTGEIKITKSMIISKTIYLVRFIMGAIGKLTVLNEAIPFYNKNETYQDMTQFSFRNFRQPHQREQRIEQRAQPYQPFQW